MRNVLMMMALLGGVQLYSQSLTTFIEKPRDYRVMFYNCENLFDTENDTLIDDEEFLPESNRHWDLEKYWKKQNNIAKVITAAGGWEFPDLVGLCELENRKVMEDLTHKTPLSKAAYKILHFESPDHRGIDVALLYRDKRFEPIEYRAIPVKDTAIPDLFTRDILYAKGKTCFGDTLHVFINHWPSRSGGELESENRRECAARTLKKVTDSLFLDNSKVNIIILGDLNDEPYNKSVKDVLKALPVEDSVATGEGLFNLSAWYGKKTGLGSHKYRGKWGVLDQCIVSGGLLSGKGSIYTTVNDYTVMNAPFLLEPDNRNLGEQPNRTYWGMKFHDGYSDHLPVILNLYRRK